MLTIQVVAPSLNQATYVGQSARSVLKQLGPKDQYSFVDGGSSDGTIDIVSGLVDDRAEVLIVPGCSQAEALAIGFERSSSDICCYLNTDDLLLPGTIDKVRALFSTDQDLSCVYSNRVFINERGRVTGRWLLPRHSNYLMSRWDYVPQETSFWRRSLMEDVGGVDPNLSFAIDYDLFLRFMKHSQMRHVGDYYGAFRVHGKSKTTLLNRSIGQAEVSALQARHDVAPHIVDRLLGALLRRYIDARSSLDVDTARSLQALVDEATRKN